MIRMVLRGTTWEGAHLRKNTLYSEFQRQGSVVRTAGGTAGGGGSQVKQVSRGALRKHPACLEFVLSPAKGKLESLLSIFVERL